MTKCVYKSSIKALILLSAHPLLGALSSTQIPCKSKNELLRHIKIYGSDDHLINELFEAASDGSAEVIGTLLDQGVPPTAPATFKMEANLFQKRKQVQLGTEEKCTPLEQAARFGNLPFLKEYKKRNLTIPHQELLSYAAYSLQGPILTYLIEEGAVPLNYPQQNEGRKTLMHVCTEGHRNLFTYHEYPDSGALFAFPVISLINEHLTECIEILKSAGVSLSTGDIHGNTPLHKAYGTVPLLVRAGADLNSLNGRKVTALYEVSTEDQKELINAGAHITRLSHQGQSMLTYLLWITAMSVRSSKSYANVSQHSEVIKALFNKGLFFNELDMTRWHVTLFGRNITSFIKTPEAYKYNLRKELIDVAPLSYAFFIPSEEQLTLSRARIAEFLVGCRLRYNAFIKDKAESEQQQYIQLREPYLLGWIITADSSTHPEGTESFHRQDLITILLDQLRWGNPQKIFLLMQAKDALITYLTDRIVTLYRDSYQPSGYTFQDTDQELKEFREAIKPAVAEGLSQRISGLSQFGTSPSASNQEQVCAFIATVFPKKSEKWRAYVLKVHSIK